MTNRGMTESSSSPREPEHNHRVFIFKSSQWIWLLLGFLEVLIALRIVLKLIGANQDSPIAALIYGFTSLFLFPFSNLIGTPVAGGMVLEVTSMIAMLVYALIAWGLERIIWVIFYRPRNSVTEVTQISATEPHSPR